METNIRVTAEKHQEVEFGGRKLRHTCLPIGPYKLGHSNSVNDWRIFKAYFSWLMNLSDKVKMPSKRRKTTQGIIWASQRAAAHRCLGDGDLNGWQIGGCNAVFKICVHQFLSNRPKTKWQKNLLRNKKQVKFCTKKTQILKITMAPKKKEKKKKKTRLEPVDKAVSSHPGGSTFHATSTKTLGKKSPKITSLSIFYIIYIYAICVVELFYIYIYYSIYSILYVNICKYAVSSTLSTGMSLHKTLVSPLFHPFFDSLDELMPRPSSPFWQHWVADPAMGIIVIATSGMDSLGF